MDHNEIHLNLLTASENVKTTIIWLDHRMYRNMLLCVIVVRQTVNNITKSNETQQCLPRTEQTPL